MSGRLTAEQRERKRCRDSDSKRRVRALARGEDPAPRDRLRAGRVALPVAVAVPDLTGAACIGADPGLFFPERVTDDISAAVAICSRCPVRARCAQRAEANGERYGVWAGVDRSASRVAA